MEENSKINSICRLCSIKNDSKQYFDVYRSVAFVKEQTITLQEAISSTINVKIFKKDKYSRSVCGDCKNQVFSFFKFKQKCRQIFNSLSSTDDNESEVTSDNIKNNILINFTNFLSNCDPTNLKSSESSTSFSVYLSESSNDDLKSETEIKEESSEVSQDPIDIPHSHTPSNQNEEFEDSDNDFEMEAEYRMDVVSDDLDDLPDDEKSSKRKSKKKKLKKLICPYYCDFQTTSTHKMNVHNQQHKGIEFLISNKDIQFIECKTTCQSIFLTEEDLENHIHNENCKAKNVAMCRYCPHPRRSSHFQALRHHLVFRHMKKFTCPVDSCKVDLDSHTSLFFHIVKRHPDYLKISVDFSCKFCSQDFETYPLLIKHYRVCSSKKIPCPECNKMVGNEDALKNHLRQHIVQICNICGKQLKGRSFIVHMQTHERKVWYKCKICNRRFKSSGDRNDHIDAFHQEKMKYQCEKCNYQAKSYGRLATHKKNHSGKVQCYICSQIYASTKSLDSHLRYVHKVKVDMSKATRIPD